MTAKELAVLSAETMMRTYSAADLPPKGHFHYHQGVFLSGMLSVYKLTGERKYFDYVKAWVDAMLGEDGIPTDMLTNEPDDLQPGVLLIELYRETGDEKYLRLIHKIAGWMMELKRNPEGGIWHKDHLKDQMWLDSMYMAGVFTSRYAEIWGGEEHRAFVRRQAELMVEHCRDKQTGLYYHAWDYSKEALWADPSTGRSKSFWGRAMGWFDVAMQEIAATLPKGSDERNYYEQTGKELICALLKYRDEKTGLWSQVVDQAQRAGNWSEISCSCLFLYAMTLAAAEGVISRDEIMPQAKVSLAGIEASLNLKDDYLGVRGVCIGTGVKDGSYEHYIARPTSENDLHGVGAFLLMACEYSKVFEA